MSDASYFPDTGSSPAPVEKDTPSEEVTTEEAPEAEEADEADVSADDEGSEEEEASAESSDDVEIDIDGEKYIVPKKLQAAFLKNADYTQKTTELARQREAYEAAQEEIAKRSEDQAAFLEDITELRAMDKGLREFSQIDWNTLSQTDPTRAFQLQLQYQQLRDAYGARKAGLDEKMSTHATESAKREAAETEKAIAALKAPDPANGWPGYSEAHMAKIASAARGLGVTDAELRRVKSPVAIKLLNLAVLGQQSLKAAKKAATPTVEANPVPHIKGNRTVTAKNPDKMPIDDWVKMERARMARKAAAASRNR